MCACALTVSSRPLGCHVQHVTEATEERSEGATGWGDGGPADPDLPDKESAGYEDEGGDSKAMRLTLMEEVLLLGLKDREVKREGGREGEGVREWMPKMSGCANIRMCTCTHTHKHAHTYTGLHLLLE